MNVIIFARCSCGEINFHSSKDFWKTMKNLSSKGSQKLEYLPMSSPLSIFFQSIQVFKTVLNEIKELFPFTIWAYLVSSTLIYESSKGKLNFFDWIFLDKSCESFSYLRQYKERHSNHLYGCAATSVTSILTNC